jgi:MFS family permease
MTSFAEKTLKDSRVFRWAMLVISSLLIFAAYYFYDVFSPLKDLMMTDLGIDSGSFGIVISATTWANCLGMIVVGGMILDRWGIRVSSVIFGALVTLGAALTTLGASDLVVSDSTDRILLMAVGRIVFGIGTEIVGVVVSVIVVKWFKGYELALAMAISTGFGRLGSYFAVSFSLDIAGNRVLPVLGVATALIAVAFLFILVYLVFDRLLDRQLLQTGDFEDEKFHISDFLKLVRNPTFLWITSLCVMYYSAVFPFVGAYGPSILHDKFGFSLNLPDASSHLSFWDWVKAYLTNGPRIAGLIPLASLVFTPIFGAFVDRKGKAASMMFLGSVLLIFAHVSLTFFDITALTYLALICLGAAFSLVPAAMWPSVAKIVPESRLGTAYATMYTVQNWGLALFYWLPGQLLENTDSDYTIAFAPFVILGVISIACAIQLSRSDRKYGYGLELPSDELSPKVAS